MTAPDALRSFIPRPQFERKSQNLLETRNVCWVTSIHAYCTDLDAYFSLGHGMGANCLERGLVDRVADIDSDRWIYRDADERFIERRGYTGMKDGRFWPTPAVHLVIHSTAGDDPMEFPVFCGHLTQAPIIVVSNTSGLTPPRC